MAKSQVIIGVKGEVNLTDLDKGIAKLQAMKAEANGTSTQMTKFGDSVLKLGGVLAATFTVSKVVDFFQQSAQAAMEDEKSLIALAKAMDNLGLAQKNAAAEDLLRSMSLQFGVADDLLRPAFQRLVTATRDVEQSQRLLQTALDISAAGYADLESAAKALSAASMGNFTALQRLRLPIDANTLAAKDFEGAIAQLNQTVGGQAAAASETYAGKLARINVAAQEAQETIGYALLQALDETSKAFGGVDGVNNAITGFGESIADSIRPLGTFMSAVAWLNNNLPDLKFNIAGINAEIPKMDFKGTALDVLSFATNLRGLRFLGPSLEAIGIYMEQGARNTRAMTSATVQAAIAAGNARGSLSDMTEGLAEVAAAAYQAAGSYMAFFESVVNKQRVQRDLANTSGTVSSAILEGVTKGADLTEAKLKEIRERIEKAARGSGGASKGGASKQAEEFVVLDAAMRRTLQTVNRTAMGYDSLTRSLGGDEIAAFSRKMLAAGTITQDTKDDFEALVGTIRDRLTTAIEGARRELDAWQQKYDDVLNTVQAGIRSGNGVAEAAQAQADAVQALADAQQAYNDALAGGNAEEISKTSAALAKAKDRQGTFLSFLQVGVDSAEAFGQQIQQLVKANASLDLVQQIVQLGARTGSRVAAELLAGGAAAIANANRMVAAVGKAALDAGTLAAQTFYGAGLASAKAYVDALEGAVRPLLQNVLNSIAAQIAAALRTPVNANIGGGGGGAPVPPTQETVAAATPRPLGAYTPTLICGAPNIPSGEGSIYAELMALSRRAGGGPVMSGTPYIVGEVGPEVFVPHSSGTIIPNGGLGNSYSITVNAGVGDPRQIGEQIVTYIKRFEQASGQVFASA